MYRVWGPTTQCGSFEGVTGMCRLQGSSIQYLSIRDSGHSISTTGTEEVQDYLVRSVCLEFRLKLGHCVLLLRSAAPKQEKHALSTCNS